MSDILFRYLLMARERDRSSYQRYFASDESLLEAGLEELVETAAVRLTLFSQHEAHFVRQIERPASEHRDMEFFDAAEPVPPEPEQAEERTEVFPLRGTLEVGRCGHCKGRVEVACGRCRGQKKTTCKRCRGTGKSLTSFAGGSRAQAHCHSCGGYGARPCSGCRGRGVQICSACCGEGETAKWTEEVYDWRIETRSLELDPVHDERFLEAVDRWLEIDPEEVKNLGRGCAADHLGFETADSLEVIARAESGRRRLVKEARKSGDRYLFHRTECSLIPVGYARVRVAGKARFFFLVGRGEKAQDVEPGGEVDRVKAMGWFGLSSSGLVAWEGAAHLLDGVGVQILGSLQILQGAPQLGVAGIAAVSGALVARGAHRVLSRPRPVTTIGLLPASSEPTPWLICLAYLGSYTRRLKVLDRAYDAQLERLCGKPRSERQSEGLTLEIQGRRVRLIEIARPDRLSAEEIGFALRALDGVLLVEDREGQADELERRLHTLAVGQPRGWRPPPIARAAVDRSSDAALDTAHGLPLEAIRRAFVEDIRSAVDWEELFDRVWRPIGNAMAVIDGRSAGRTSISEPPEAPSRRAKRTS